jgi:hypothetical protein
MSNLPAPSTKTSTLKRVMTNDGTVYVTWYKVTDDGILVLDPQWHAQYRAGEWQYVYEKKTTTIEYSVE